MALPRSLLHIILFLQSVFLYWAVLRFSFRQFGPKIFWPWGILKPNIENASRLRDTAGRCRSASAEGKRIVELGVSLYHMSIDAYCFVNPQLHTTFIESLSNSAKNKHFEKKAADDVERPLYIVTPTYTRPTQLADLTRLANTLRLASILIVCFVKLEIGKEKLYFKVGRIVKNNI